MQIIIELTCSIFMSSNNILQFFLHIEKGLKIHQLNIIKIIKKRLQEKLVKDINVFLRKKKKKKEQYGSERYKTLPEGEKQKLVEYRKKYYKMRKNDLL